jgi:signal transduction histidine kinase
MNGAGDERAAEASVVRQQGRLAAAGALAWSVVQSLSSLLCVLDRHVQVLKEQAEPRTRAESLAAMDHVVQQCNELSGALLAFLRQEERPPQPIDLQAIVAQVLGLLRRTVAAHLEVDLEAEENLPRVWADPTQMLQVVLNLCLNAVASMPCAGQLRVQLDTCEAPRSSLVLAPPALFVRLRVSDTGTGIDPQVQEKIFEPFFTMQGTERGTGLGLAIAADVVGRHGGWVECQSGVGQGARFTVYLPAWIEDSR